QGPEVLQRLADAAERDAPELVRPAAGAPVVVADLPLQAPSFGFGLAGVLPRRAQLGLALAPSHDFLLQVPAPLVQPRRFKALLGGLERVAPPAEVFGEVLVADFSGPLEVRLARGPGQFSTAQQQRVDTEVDGRLFPFGGSVVRVAESTYVPGRLD